MSVKLTTLKFALKGVEIMKSLLKPFSLIMFLYTMFVYLMKRKAH